MILSTRPPEYIGVPGDTITLGIDRENRIITAGTFGGSPDAIFKKIIVCLGWAKAARDGNRGYNLVGRTITNNDTISVGVCRPISLRLVVDTGPLPMPTSVCANVTPSITSISWSSAGRPLV